MTRLPVPQDVQAAFAWVVVDEWQRNGVTEAVICPGSRSTPLLIALAEAAEWGDLRLHVLLDERAAGFFALGLGLARGVPAPIVTTSGTAAAELHPSVLEAHHAGVPMLAVTADRPPELHDCGAPQSINQVGLFGDAVRWEASPGVPELAAAWSWRSLASRAVIEARGGAARPGPVHLNLAFREPLVGHAELVLTAGSSGSADEATQQAMGSGVALGGDRVLRDLVNGRPGRAPWHFRRAAVESVPPRDVVELLARAGERGLIVAGASASVSASGAMWLGLGAVRDKGSSPTRLMPSGDFPRHPAGRSWPRPRAVAGYLVPSVPQTPFCAQPWSARGSRTSCCGSVGRGRRA